MMHDIAAIISSITQLGWVAIVVFLLWRHHKPLSNLIERISKFHLKLPDGTEVELTANEAASVAQQLLDETDDLIKDIDPEDQELLSRIVAESRPLTVEELFPGFSREGDQGHPTEALQRLRKLREKQLIRPTGGGKFKPEKGVEIKRFGRILLKLRSENLLGRASRPN